MQVPPETHKGHKGHETSARKPQARFVTSLYIGGRWMPGAGGEILHDEVRKDISPLKCTGEEWIDVHRQGHKQGLKSTGTMMIGVGENSPQNPHHRNSDTFGVLLTGALVAGPTQRAYTQGQGAMAIEITAPGYEDVTEDYVGNEVALDYNAGVVGLGAFGVLQQASGAEVQ